MISQPSALNFSVCFFFFKYVCLFFLYVCFFLFVIIYLFFSIWLFSFVFFSFFLFFFVLLLWIELDLEECPILFSYNFMSIFRKPFLQVFFNPRSRTKWRRKGSKEAIPCQLTSCLILKWINGSMILYLV